VIWHDPQVKTRPQYVCLAFALALACSDDTISADDATTTSESSSSSESDSESTGGTTLMTSSSEESDSESESETGEPEPFCGDGMLYYGEECDDGNQIEDDGCTSECISACGIDEWVDITIESGWFDVQTMQTLPFGRIALAGDVGNPGSVGRLRYISMMQSEIEGAVESAPLGSSGTMDLPQTHQITAVEMTADGGDLLALGTTTQVLVVDEPPVTSYWLARFAVDDLSVVWRVDLPGSDPEFRPLDLSVLGAGDPVITRTVEIANNDDDIQAQRRSFVDGAEVWTSTYSGEFDGGWSLDIAGKVAVGTGDRLWLAGIVRVDWQTFESTIIELDPTDGATLWAGVPLPDPGNAYEQRIWDLAAGSNGEVAIGINVMGPATQFHHFGAFMYVDQELAWELSPELLPWEDGGPYISPRLAFGLSGDVLVSGTYTHDFGQNSAARPWVIQLDADGTQLCNARVGEGSNAAIVPRNGFFGDGGAALNLDTYGAGGMGPGSAGNWVARLRGW
jgi:cysteine-rich repeat protein